jgi:pimeloyl-ACP methyl ester carboxylesterase
MSRPTIIFLHGGPGFNSRAEETVLGARFSRNSQKAIFWNEPWEKTPSFSSQLSSIQSCVENEAVKTGPVHLIAHSFATHATLRIANHSPELISEMTLVTPTPDLNGVYRAVISIAISDFEKTDAKIHEELKSLLMESQSFFDSAMIKAFELVANDPMLFLNYFNNRSALDAFLDIWTKEKLRPNADSFFPVLNEIKSLPALEPLRFSIPVKMVFGRHDRVCRVAEQAPAMKRLVPHAELIEFEMSAHFPHLEEVERFFTLL